MKKVRSESKKTSLGERRGREGGDSGVGGRVTQARDIKETEVHAPRGSAFPAECAGGVVTHR